MLKDFSDKITLYLTVPIVIASNIFYTESFRPSYFYHWITNKMLIPMVNKTFVLE